MRRQTLVIEIEVEAPDYLTDFPHDDEELDELRYDALTETLDAALSGIMMHSLKVQLPYLELHASIHTKTVYLATGGRG